MNNLDTVQFLPLLSSATNMNSKEREREGAVAIEACINYTSTYTAYARLWCLYMYMYTVAYYCVAVIILNLAIIMYYA